MERAWREMSPNCPRCGSSNTKFCYYNNYSLTQPRYFCKGCRRYWTKGGSLRNVPIGGGCRKSRRGNRSSLRLVGGTGHGVGGTVITSRNTTGTHAYSRLQGGLNGCSSVNINGRSYGGSMNGALVTHDHHGHSQSSFSAADPPHIDLAVVYANFLNSKEPAADSNDHDEQGLPGGGDELGNNGFNANSNPNFELQMTSIGGEAPNMILNRPQMQREEHSGINVECPVYSGGGVLPMLVGTNEFDRRSIQKQQEDQQINVAGSSQLGSSHNHHDHCTTTKGFGLTLPPLPGEDHPHEVVVPWHNIHDHSQNHLFFDMQTTHTNMHTRTHDIHMPVELLEPAGQTPHHHHQSFIDSSSCWSPLDLSSYETSSRLP